MKIILALLILAASTAYGQYNVKTFPPNAKPGGSYTVTQNEAVLVGEELYLPQGFTINVAPDVTDLDWKFDLVRWDANTTINLKRGVIQPRPAPGMPGGDSRSCYAGGDGSPGSPGRPGANGVNLKLAAVTGAPNGHLWICTSGDDGGPGGDGGRGGSGGHGDCRACGGNAGNGGNGGRGGNGGSGGNTGRVSFSGFNKSGNARYINMGCEVATRPVPGPGNQGTISVSGVPGRGGSQGFGGAGGNGGFGQNCGKSNGRNGSMGNMGDPGNPGQGGICKD